MGRATRWFRSLLGGTKAAEDRPAKKKKGWGFIKTFQKDRPQPTAVALSSGEHRMRAIAVAAAVVRLTTGNWRAEMKVEERAAVEIQAAFRGYLARRARRALKGLVRLQALVRGTIVRKQAAETLRCMKALIRVQARARAVRALHSEMSRPSKGFHPYPGPGTPENYEAAIRSMASKCMDEHYWCRIGSSESMEEEQYVKALGVGNDRSLIYSRRASSLGHLQSDRSAESLNTAADSLSKDSYTPTQLSTPSPLPFNRRQRRMLSFPAIDSGDSPQQSGSSRRGPFTPAKSEHGQSLFEGHPSYPNYMSKTESSIAKLRSRSAPRQRPECETRPWAQDLGHPASRSLKLQAKAYPGSGRLDKLGMPVGI